jgi:hypothetical protein
MINLILWNFEKRCAAAIISVDGELVHKSVSLLRHRLAKLGRLRMIPRGVTKESGRGESD